MIVKAKGSEQSKSSLQIIATGSMRQITFTYKSYSELFKSIESIIKLAK